jgi:hypothetical protein
MMKAMLRTPRCLAPALLIFAVVLAAVVPLNLWGASFVSKEFDQLVDEADEIFIGTVTQLQSRRLPAGAVVTDVTFSSRQVMKGGGAGDFVLVVMGGTLDGVTVKLAGFPEFQLGESYLVFARDNGRVILPIVGGPQGLFRIRPDPTTGERLVFDSRGLPVRHPSVLRALAGPARPERAFGAVAPIPLDAFVQAVRARLGQK